MQHTIQKLLAPLGITALTPIQNEALENYKNCQELILYAPTGTGKTLAFLLPLVEMLNEIDKENKTRALILSPTRELALQIESVFKSLKTGYTITSCYGGHAIQTELNNLSAKPDIVVGTPGRIVDHIQRETLEIGAIYFFIIDEFDNCLELGFHEEIAAIYGETCALKKLIFGSATKLEKFPVFIQLSNPIVIDKTSSDVPVQVQFFRLKTIQDKYYTVQVMLSQFGHERIIVFCNFRDDVENLSAFLIAQEIIVSAYHGGLEQDERERALIKFRNASSSVLVCTDLGARGLDIPEVKHIIHYELPENFESFIHRNGRTARMQENGAVYFFEEDQRKSKFDTPKCAAFEPDFNKAYLRPKWITIYFSAGKKNKISKIDLLGFLCQQGGLEKEQVGVMTILDYSSFVAVQSTNPRSLIACLRVAKVKGQKLKIDLAY